MLGVLRVIGRLVLFWLVVVIPVAVGSLVFPFLDPGLVFRTIGNAFHQDIAGVSRPEFAYALAGIIGATALGFALAFGLFHLARLSLTLLLLRRAVVRAQGRGGSRAEDRRSFAENFQEIGQRFERSWLIGHAWIEFEESLFDTDSAVAIGNTTRPQAFFNMGLARERLGGLKMMNAIPGYFVGVGLLLTFIGLVFALHKAGEAADAGDAQKMAGAMGELLKIATFKFSTSIAGLAASILLSIVFRFYTIWIEAAFERFNASLERGLRYEAPQSIALEMSRTLQDQLVQLKDITQGDFFARMGSEIAPRLGGAISQAMSPITEHIGSAVGSLTTTSRDGLEQLLLRFTDSLQGGAGTEMRELAVTLRQLQLSMVEIKGGMQHSGADFASKLAEAADTLNTAVARAGQSFERSSAEGRDALADIVDRIRSTFELANSEIGRELGAAATGASARLEDAMTGVMQQLGGQVVRTSAAMEALQAAMASQAVALEHASTEAQRTASALGAGSQSIREATGPLATVAGTFSGATERMASGVEATLAALTRAQQEIDALAASLSAASDRAERFWAGFDDKFADVDTALGHAVGALSESMTKGENRLGNHVREVDEGLTKAVQNLSGFLSQMSESAEAIADNLAAIKGITRP